MAKARTILIVDDDQFNRVVLRDVVQDTGCEIVEAADGTQAIEALQKYQPAVMLLDLFMPEKSGMDVLQRVGVFSPSTKTLVISSMSSDAMIAAALQAGACGFLGKPVQPVEVLEAVEDLLAE